MQRPGLARGDIGYVKERGSKSCGKKKGRASLLWHWFPQANVETHLWVLKLPWGDFRGRLRGARARTGRRRGSGVMATAYGVVEGVAAIALSTDGLRVGCIWHVQTGIRILAAISRKVLAKHVLESFVESSANARLGSGATDSGGAGYGGPSIVFKGKAHAVLATAGAWTEAGRGLRNIFVGIIEEAAPDPVGHAVAVGGRGPGCGLGSGARSRGRVS